MLPLQVPMACELAWVRKTPRCPVPPYEPATAKLPVKPTSPLPLMVGCRPATVNFDGFSPVQLILTLTLTDPALVSKPLQVAPFCPLGVLVLMGLTATVEAGGAGFPPEHEPRVAETV